ncbi:EAL domain-containing protein [Psychrobacillus sp. FJAT-51614]|uniref:EAL domain-containing protein n=1 Tax=Psychrobacillus mangrovi TaxID=3117745 RepID=A0ABU8FAA1_9BACI
MQIETELKKAIQNEQLSLFYQPKVDLHTERIIGMEALLRWEHPDLGSISPVEFIPVAEETGQIVSIGEWVLLQACQQNKKWQEQGLPSLCVSVNVSVLQFQHGQFLETVQIAIKESQLDPKFLELEITESIMQNFKESNEILKGLRQLGIKTSVDDFGTGYSSLTVLQKLPIDTIKIDKSFVDELEKEGHNFMVKTIIDLSHNLELNVVAEGIETDRQMKILKDNSCMIGQGYLFSKPVAADELEVLLREEVSR